MGGKRGRGKRKELERKIANGQQDIDTFGELAEIYYQEGKIEKVFELYNMALELPLTARDKAIILGERGIAYLDINELEKARNDFEKSLDILNKEVASAKILYSKAQSYFHLQWIIRLPEEADNIRYEAIKNFMGIIEEYQDFEMIANCYLYLGYLYDALGEYDKALEFSEIALKKSFSAKDKAAALHQMGIVLFDRNKITDAEKYYQEALKHADDKSFFSKIHYDLGLLYHSQEQHDKAINTFQKALKYKDYNLSLKFSTEYLKDIEWNLGVQFHEKKEYKKAIKHFRNALSTINEQHKGFCNIQLWIGNCYYEMQNYKNAEEHYKQVLSSKLASNEDVVQAQSYLANICSQQKRYDEAVKEYKKLFELSPKHREDPIVLSNLGIAYTQLGEKAKAIDCLEKIITDNLTTPLLSREDILYRLACLYLEQERYKEFNEYSKLLIHEFPNGALTQKISEYRRKYEFPKEGDNVQL